MSIFFSPFMNTRNTLAVFCLFSANLDELKTSTCWFSSSCVHTSIVERETLKRELKINSNYVRSIGLDRSVGILDFVRVGNGEREGEGEIIGATVDDIFWHLRTLFARDTVNGAITSNCVENAWPSTIEPDYCAFQQLSVHVSDRCRWLSFLCVCWCY